MSSESNELKILVQKVTDLPTLPVMMATITRLMQDPRTSAEELGRAISSDPALVTKVLKLVNSAFYGFPGRISTITQAIMILGFSTIRNVVLTTSVLKAFGKDSAKKGFNIEKFWEHSLLTGAIGRALAIEAEGNFIEETFIAGLLHDMGRIFLSQKLTPEFEKVIAYREKLKAENKVVSWLEAEQAVLNLTHGEIGGWLARKWNLPDPFIQVMIYHHQPMSFPSIKDTTQLDTANLICFIHAADFFAKGLKDGAIDESAMDLMDPEVRKTLKLDSVNWDSLKHRAADEIDKARAFLEIL